MTSEVVSEWGPALFARSTQKKTREKAKVKLGWSNTQYADQ